MDSAQWLQLVATVGSAGAVLLGLAVYSGRLIQRIDHLEKGFDADGAARVALEGAVKNVEHRVTVLEVQRGQG